MKRNICLIACAAFTLLDMVLGRDPSAFTAATLVILAVSN